MKKVVMSSEYGVVGEVKETNRNVFAICDNECVTMNVRTDMEHRIHLKKRYGVSPDDYANLIRGYISPGKIIFYKAAGFTKANDIPTDVLKLVVSKSIDLYGPIECELYNTNNGKLELLESVDE